MSFPILICDDSALARKQLARSLPTSLNADVHFAIHGLDALAQLQQREFRLMFLDLTMPELDGFATLEKMRELAIAVPVVVVSGDIQPKAHERVLALGAKAFIQKPLAPDALRTVLKTWGPSAESVVQALSVPSRSSSVALTSSEPNIESVRDPVPVRDPIAALVLKRRDIYREVANVAIGRAADTLARHFDVFVNLPLPNVNIFEVSELHMTLRDLADNDRVSGVCQGFSGEGIAGEALVLLSDSSVADLNRLMKTQAGGEEIQGSELLLDVANILVGSFLNGLGEQAEVRFFQSPPVLLGQQLSIESVIQSTSGGFNKTMTFEVSYTIANTSIRCDMLFMFVDASLPLLDSKLAYLMEDL